MCIRDRLVLIDGHSILNRAYHGLPDLTNSEAVSYTHLYGIMTVLLKLAASKNRELLMVITCGIAIVELAVNMACLLYTSNDLSTVSTMHPVKLKYQ